MADEYNLSGLTPVNQGTPVSPSIQQPTSTDDSEGGYNLSGMSVLDPEQAHENSNEEKYGTIPQQILTGIEGVGKGVIGPLAPAIEQGLGLTTGKDIMAREETNPVSHIAGEATGFIGSALTGVGAAPIAEAIGKGALGLTGVKGATVLSKLAASGIKASAEMMALSTSDELSKLVEGDPAQGLGSAAINIGLSGVLGGVGGVALGGVSQLWNKASNVIGVEKLATDYMAETKALENMGNPVESATKELKGRMDEADNMWNTMSETKPEVLQRAMPEMTAENAGKIDTQIQGIADEMTSALKRADQSVKTKSAVPFLYEDFSNFQEAISKPEVTFADKFKALNKLKTDLQGYAKWAATEEGTAKGALGRSLSNIIKPALEDTKVWGAAADVQKVTNEAITEMIKATKDMRGAVTSKLLGEAEIAPEKVQTLINQTNAGKISRKANIVQNYLDATDKYANAIRTVHIENGLEDPLAATLNPTPTLNHALGTELSPGVKLARWINDKGTAALGNAVGKGAAGITGGGIGALIGHPLAGAWMGEKILAPIMSAIARPLAETAVNSLAAKATVDYLGNVAKGQRLLGNSVASLFSKGAEVIAKDLIPDHESRNKLKKAVDTVQNTDSAMDIGGKVGHYLPNHGTAAAQTAATAANYLDSLKPKQVTTSPLDAEPPIDKQAEARYNRALDIAEQPLMVLKHTKDGTLTPHDVRTIRTIYPALHDAIIRKTTDALIDHKTKGLSIPYHQRVSMNLLIGGNPLDGTMTPMAMQSVINSASPKSLDHAQSATGGRQKGGASNATLAQMNKVASLYKTPLEARQVQKRTT